MTTSTGRRRLGYRVTKEPDGDGFDEIADLFEGCPEVLHRLTYGISNGQCGGRALGTTRVRQLDRLLRCAVPRRSDLSEQFGKLGDQEYSFPWGPTFDDGSCDVERFEADHKVGRLEASRS